LVYNMPFPLYTSGGLLLLTALAKWCTQMLVNASGDIMSGLKQKTWTTGGQWTAPRGCSLVSETSRGLHTVLALKPLPTSFRNWENLASIATGENLSTPEMVIYELPWQKKGKKLIKKWCSHVKEEDYRVTMLQVNRTQYVYIEDYTWNVFFRTLQNTLGNIYEFIS
jgi:hypothetical protein